MEKSDTNPQSPHIGRALPQQSTFEKSDREQARLRLIFPICALLWSSCYPLKSDDQALIHNLNIETHSLVALAYIVVAILISLSWRLVYRRIPRAASALRLFCLFSDITAISVYTFVSDRAAIVLLPIYLSAIIGYGMRFGHHYLLTALLAGITEFSFAISGNDFLRENPAIIVTYFLSMFFLPVYTLILLRKYSDVFLAYIDASNERELFIEIIGHEFRAPLHSIVSIAEMSQAQLRTSRIETDAVRICNASFQDILICAERMLAVANRVTTFTKTRERVRHCENPVSIFRVVYLSSRICGIYAHRKNLRLRWNIDANVPCHTSLDTNTLQEILINLLDNSIKNTATGEVRLQLKLSESSTCGPTLEFSVADTGSGFPSERQRAGKTAKEGDSLILRGNLGLGLAITKRNVAALSGMLDFYPVEPSGTLAVVKIPNATCESRQALDDSWLYILAITKRALTTSELTALFGARLIPRYAFGTSGATVSSAQDNISLCACFEDQSAAIKEIQCSGVWPALDSLPLVLFRARDEFMQEEGLATANFCVDPHNPGLASALLRSFRTTIYAAPTSDSSVNSSSYRGTVLLLDDSEVTTRAIHRTLEGLGFRCFVALCLEEANAILQSTPVDVVVADRYVGHDDILDYLAPSSLIVSSGARIILMSADSGIHGALNSSGVSVDLALVKPVSTRQLKDSLERVIPAIRQQYRKEERFHMVDWALLEELVGAGTDDDQNRELLGKFEEELLIEAMRIETAIVSERFSDLSGMLHRMSGVAMLFGAAGLAAFLEQLRVEARSPVDSDHLMSQMRDVYSIILDFTQLCRDHRLFQGAEPTIDSHREV
jgi:signal transduction histidine kinase/DNA-binding response OmpR family regulator